ncbi:MAG: alpha-1,2-fucosyltransferase [Lachnospiraceae bacterium]|nr:alpha-1,2-fucosyltransferase [Lachnospiraceae bacterium]
MIIIQMMGGLGNQMFQYALYSQLKSMGKEVKMDDRAGFVADKQRDPELGVFGVDYIRATEDEIIKMRDSSLKFTARVRRKLFGRKNNSYFEESRLFQSKIFGWDNIYLEGYWQSEKYFKDVGQQLRREFSVDRLKSNPDPDYRFSPESESYLWKIEQTQSVSIHIRRGDYLLPQNQELFGNICTDYYYEQAMQAITGKYPNCIFYIFTNDLEWSYPWLKRRSDGKNKIIPVEVPKGRDHEALVLMSRCKHNILANSSFSWWASYLNDNPGKVVIAPEKWLNGWDCSDIYRPDMTKIKCES